MSNDQDSGKPDKPVTDPVGAKATAAERRRSPRFDIDGMQGRMQIQSNARVLNLSMDGLAIETSMAIRVGDDYVVLVDTDKDVVPLRAKAVWCNLVGTDASENGDIRPIYHAGLQIGVGLSSSAQNILEFIERNSPIEIKQRLYGRFEISSKRDVSLRRLHLSNIRTLNAHGLLMESTALVEPGDRLLIELDLLEGKGFRAYGKVVFVGRGKAGAASGTHRIGLEFESLDDPDRRALADFLEQLVKN